MISLALLLTTASSALAATIYVSPTGTTAGTGTLASPYLSIQSAVDAAVPGDTIYLRGGTYSPAKNIAIKKNGTASAHYTLTAYGGESVVIDGEALTGTPAAVDASLAEADRGILHFQNAWYWDVSKITLINGPYGVYVHDCSNNIFSQIVTHDNYETGFQMQGVLANNQVLYLDSYMNRDPRKNGESADGFGCKEGSGTGNIIKGARLWNNVDDGLDLWYASRTPPPHPQTALLAATNPRPREFKSAVTIQDTISWGNGYNRWSFSPFAGDGNGFKLGGGNAGDIGPANHVVKNSISFGNSAKGFTDNKQTGVFTFTRNTAWNNAGEGFQITTATGTLTGNVAAVNQGVTTRAKQTSLTGVTSSGNSWDSSTTTWSNSSFESIDSSLVQGARGSDGKIAASNFLLPASGAAIGATTAWS